MPRLPKGEKELLDSVEAGEWSSVAAKTSELGHYQRYARATFKKDRRINIRISTRDLEALQKRALVEGVPFQTLISSVLHKYASGRLREEGV
jgi:predicted DNA binding CopG/RHH family protein